MSDNSNIKIALLLGGTSPEREVSKSSGKSIYWAVKNLGYNVVLIDPAYGEDQPEDENLFFDQKNYREISNRNYVAAINLKLFDSVDTALLALHGKWGEDGTIQSLLELRGVKYTGSNVLSSALSMDKAMSKILFDEYNVATPRWFAVKSSDYKIFDVLKLIDEKTGYPCVIKPNDQGSTVGLTICPNSSGVEEAVKLASRFSDKVLFEEYIPGHECTVGILDNQPLPPLEIKPKHAIYDYECKYTAGMSQYEVPAEFPEEVKTKLQQQALAAFNALNCKGYGRVDFRMDENFNIFCLEVNTLPGMTSTSLVPKMAKAVGISFEELIDRIIKSSL